MSLWHRAPREVYRVYGEDQYLEGERAPEGETTAREDTTTVEPESGAGASWESFAAEVPPTPNTAGSPSARPSGSHAGRLIGVGLLVGVGLATLALVLLNVSNRHGDASERGTQGTRVETRQRVAGAGRASAIAHNGSRPVSTPRFSASSAMKPERQFRSRFDEDAPPAGNSDSAPRVQRVWSAALRSSGNVAPASVAVQSPAPVALESPVLDPVEPSVLSGVEPLTPVSAEHYVQDEFGFER
jgi:hypothetical protein